MSEKPQPLGMRKGARLTNANNEDYYTSTEVRLAAMWWMEHIDDDEKSELNMEWFNSKTHYGYQEWLLLKAFGVVMER